MIWFNYFGVVPLPYFCGYTLFDSWIQTLIGSNDVLQTANTNYIPGDRSVIWDKISDLSKIKPDSVQGGGLYLKLPWLGVIRDRFSNQISACVRKCYFSSNLRVVLRTRTLLTSGRKDVLSLHNVVVFLFILLVVFAVRSTSREPINVWIQELNNLYS